MSCIPIALRTLRVDDVHTLDATLSRVAHVCVARADAVRTDERALYVETSSNAQRSAVRAAIAHNALRTQRRVYVHAVSSNVLRVSVVSVHNA